MTPRRWVPARAALVVLVALVLQISLVADLRVGGVVGDLMLVLVVAAALTGGPDRAATWGFAAGVAYDLVLDTPFGLSALAYALVGYAAGVAASAMGRTSGWWPVALAVLAGAAHAALYTALGILVGVAYPFWQVPSIALGVAIAAALLVLPALRVLWWVHGHNDVDRLEVMFR